MNRTLAMIVVLGVNALFTGCVTDQRLDAQNAKKIDFIRFDPRDSKVNHIQYQGPVSLLAQAVAVTVPGVGTGIAAGVGAAADDSYASEIDRVARTNQIYLDQILEKELHQSLQMAGYTVREAKEGGAALRIKEVTQLFHRLIGNPTLVAGATLELYLPAGPELPKEQVLWRYRAVLRNEPADFPSYSYDELLIPENLRKFMEATSSTLVRDAMNYLQEPPREEKNTRG